MCSFLPGAARTGAEQEQDLLEKGTKAVPSQVLGRSRATPQAMGTGEVMAIPECDQRTRDGRGKGEGQAGAEPEHIPVGCCREEHTALGSGIKLGGSDDPSCSDHDATSPVAQRRLSHTSPELRGLQWEAAELDGTTRLGRTRTAPDQPGAEGRARPCLPELSRPSSPHLPHQTRCLNLRGSTN